ncbi:hypothetical protein AVEN_111861-1 [Araneus ventricosus]|uniref:Uncharacterized protein n=1 Tax=Araneus ventricosus TaxID=182803 RepID=A0A4Y2BZF4_ARAVE|nr:hypothetical protein AVEN_111861-1 [Araneus ventricosus]
MSKVRTSKAVINVKTSKDVLSHVLENHRITLRKLSEEGDISYGSVQSILTEDLGMRRELSRFVPKLQTKNKTGLQLRLISLNVLNMRTIFRK